MKSLPSIRLVLVETHGAQNLGACARLCENFGVDDWVAVRPKTRPDDVEALRWATGESGEMLRALRVVNDLGEALTGCGMAVAFAGKTPGQDDPPRVALPELARLAQSEAERGSRVALVFGNERYGLSTDDLVRCGHLCRLETSDRLTSLNLSHAVAVALSRIMEGGAASEDAPHMRAPAVTRAHREEIERMYSHGEELLRELGLEKAGNPARLILTFRRLFDRTGLKSNEIRAIRSIFARALRRMRS